VVEVELELVLVLVLVLEVELVRDVELVLVVEVDVEAVLFSYEGHYSEVSSSHRQLSYTVVLVVVSVTRPMSSQLQC
jgi:hypothetical protein